MESVCPMCGCAVRLVSDKEGTAHYESVLPKRVQKLLWGLRNTLNNDAGWEGVWRKEIAGVLNE